MSMWQMASTPDSGITLTDLSIFTVYNISVAASTIAGIGPFDTIAIRTQSIVPHIAIPEVTTDEVDPAVPGDNVTLQCSATGDTPFTYQWTMQGSTDVLNNDTSMGILQLLEIKESQFGTYICSVSNALGMDASNVTIEQASELS